MAGAAGTIARYGTGVFVARHAVGVFPWPTFAVNMIGCFLFGAIYAFAEDHAGWAGDVRVIVLTGFMGAYTTFSTFAFNTTNLMRDSEWLLAAGNIVSQNVLGLLCVFLGLVVGKLL